MSNYQTSTGALLTDEDKQLLQDNLDPTVVEAIEMSTDEIKALGIEAGRFMEEAFGRVRTISRLVLTDEQRELLGCSKTFELYAIPVGYDITLTTGDNS